MRIYFLTMSGAAILMAFAAPAMAATVTPVSATASTSYAGYGASNAIDAGANTDWASNSQGVGSFLNLDLGAVYSLASANIVDRVTSGGPNGTYFGGTSDFTTGFSLKLFGDSTFTNALATYSFAKPTPQSPASAAAFAYTASLAGSPAARYVQYAVQSANGANPGLSNISFSTAATAAVPEPATWAMMIAGFGMVGGTMRRKKINARIQFA